ncbi:hypothetical protein MNB_SUP05-SYMBIONT-7-252 [hydrothermal vent metagenome]|uniref:Uncharacterized protein n=1 Tax=hydrothermal vent metagenome TaxID=652676 RepID=A0A1W1E4Q0_9ZZZZ
MQCVFDFLSVLKQTIISTFWFLLFLAHHLLHSIVSLW